MFLDVGGLKLRVLSVIPAFVGWKIVYGSLSFLELMYANRMCRLEEMLASNREGSLVTFFSVIHVAIGFRSNYLRSESK